MDTNNPHSLAPHAVVGLSLLLFANGVVAEDKLVKGNASYLGWAQPEMRFRTCDGNLLVIADGKIESTKEICQPHKPILPFMVKGEVQDVDIASRTLSVKEETGTTKTFYYKPVVNIPGMVDLGHIKPGDKVTIKGSAAGRAEAVVR